MIMIHNNKIILFIPMYNCESQIARVISQLDESVQKLFVEIIIVDNRSQDNSINTARKSIEEKIKYCKVTIFQNLENYSLGGSIKVAFNYAIQQKHDYLVTLHGDDQASIKDIASIIQSDLYKNYDMCVGARFHKKSKLEGYSWFRTCGNRILNLLCSAISFRKIDDLIAGLNIYKVDFIKNAYPLYNAFPNNLTFDAHWLLYMILKKANFCYFPITWKEEDQISNAKVFKQAYTLFKLFLRFALNKRVLFEQLKNKKEKYINYDSEIIFLKERPI